MRQELASLRDLMVQHFYGAVRDLQVARKELDAVEPNKAPLHRKRWLCSKG